MPCSTRPVPPQTVQGCPSTVPVPRHAWHGVSPTPGASGGPSSPGCCSLVSCMSSSPKDRRPAAVCNAANAGPRDPRAGSQQRSRFRHHLFIHPIYDDDIRTVILLFHATGTLLLGDKQFVLIDILDIGRNDALGEFLPRKPNRFASEKSIPYCEVPRGVLVLLQQRIRA